MTHMIQDTSSSGQINIPLEDKNNFEEKLLHFSQTMHVVNAMKNRSGSNRPSIEEQNA